MQQYLGALEKHVDRAGLWSITDSTLKQIFCMNFKLSGSSKHIWYSLLGVSLPALSHPSYIPLKVCALVVQIRPWHVLWLSPLLQLVSWNAGPGVSSPFGLLSLRLDEVAAQAVVCGRALWHFPHLLLWSPNWLTTGAEDKQSPKEPIPLASLEWFR